MTQVEKMFQDRLPFVDKKGNEYRFLKFYKKSSRIHCWLVRVDKTDCCNISCTGLHVNKVSVKTLKALNVWDELSEAKQQAVVDYVDPNQVMDEQSDRKARRTKAEYAHIPRSIRCFECGKKDAIAPGIFIQKANLECKDTDDERQKIKDFIASYRCSTCVPRRRGRVRNPLFKDIPRKVNCADCGKECAINAKSVYELTEGDKGKIEDYCSKYLCRKCNPEWGSWLKGKRGRGRKPKPENEGFPKTVKCIGEGCGREVHIVPDQIRGKAKKLGITVEELLANYRCRSCGGVVPHKKKRKRKVAVAA